MNHDSVIIPVCVFLCICSNIPIFLYLGLEMLSQRERVCSACIDNARTFPKVLPIYQQCIRVQVAPFSYSHIVMSVSLTLAILVYAQLSFSYS